LLKFRNLAIKSTDCTKHSTEVLVVAQAWHQPKLSGANPSCQDRLFQAEEQKEEEPPSEKADWHEEDFDDFWNMYRKWMPEDYGEEEQDGDQAEEPVQPALQEDGEEKTPLDDDTAGEHKSAESTSSATEESRSSGDREYSFSPDMSYEEWKAVMEQKYGKAVTEEDYREWKRMMEEGSFKTDAPFETSEEEFESWLKEEGAKNNSSTVKQ